MKSLQLDPYEVWRANPTPANLANVLDMLSPTITSEIHRYSGPKTLLRSRARILAAKAVMSYDPSRGAALRSWVVSQMRPLTRYSHKLRPVATSEVNARKSAELNNIVRRMTEELGRAPSDHELADAANISVRKIQLIRSQVKPVMTEYELAGGAEESDADSAYSPAISKPSTIGLSQEVVYESLPERHKFIFKHKTGYDGAPVLPNTEIAKRLGVTPSMVTQLSGDITKKFIEVNENVI